MTRLGPLILGAVLLARAAAAGQSADTLRLVPFAAAPFPYDGAVPADGKPFITVVDGRRAHISPRGGTKWEDETYNDRRVLLYIPKGFDAARPALMVVYLHGNNATLERDVVRRQRIPAQVAASGLNAVLVAPQFAVAAADSSAGHFWEAGFFARFLAEAGRRLAELYPDMPAGHVFEAMPVVLVAYSGGYNPAAYALAVGGADSRIRGVILLEALYGETDKFAEWIARRQSAFFFSAFARSAQAENLALERLLTERRVGFRRRLAGVLAPGSVTFVAADPALDHENFATAAWVADPIRILLAKIRGYPRPVPHRRQR